MHLIVCHDKKWLSSRCRFIPLLFTLLSSPSETLKGAAADVLTEVISKRMEPQNKLGLIQQLGLGRVCAQWGNGLPVQDGEYELATKYAKLLATIVTGKAKKIFCRSNILC
jgi:exportin-T